MIFEYKTNRDHKYNKTIVQLINILKSGGELADFIINNPKFHK
jgi:hypothetical protein